MKGVVPPVKAKTAWATTGGRVVSVSSSVVSDEPVVVVEVSGDEVDDEPEVFVVEVEVVPATVVVLASLPPVQAATTSSAKVVAVVRFTSGPSPSWPYLTPG
jgi:hypothetical protein